MAPSPGITAPKKGTPRSACPGGWDREFEGCGESAPPSGKKRQPPGMACVCKPLFGRNGFPYTMGDLQICLEVQSAIGKAAHLPFPLRSLQRHYVGTEVPQDLSSGRSMLHTLSHMLKKKTKLYMHMSKQASSTTGLVWPVIVCHPIPHLLLFPPLCWFEYILLFFLHGN